MVLEDLIPVKVAEQKPINMLPIAFLYSTIAIFLAMWIFPGQMAIVAVFLTTLACLPLMLNVVGFEKEKEESEQKYLQNILFSFFSGYGKHPLSENQDKLISFFVWLFIGFTLSFAFWLAILPPDMVNNLFYIQMNTIRDINANVGTAGSAIFGDYFTKILFNNMRVLAFSIFFSFIYGAGAVFIIVWNSSVIGVAIGDSIRNSISNYVKDVGLTGMATYSSVISTSILRYMLHGIPEILAYFIGCIAGGLISIAIIKNELDSEIFKKTIYHVLGLVALAIGLLLFAGILEVTISPLLTIKS